MGLLDNLKQRASDVATTAVSRGQETAKLGQLQMQLRALKNEERDTQAEFGREAYRLHGLGMLADGSPELTALAAKIADVQARVADKEREMGDLRGTAAEDGDTVESDAEEVVPAGGDGAAGEPLGSDAGGTPQG